MLWMCRVSLARGLGPGPGKPAGKVLQSQVLGKVCCSFSFLLLPLSKPPQNPWLPVLGPDLRGEDGHKRGRSTWQWCAPLPLVLGVGVGGDQEEEEGDQPPGTPPPLTYREVFDGKPYKVK